MQKGKKNWKKLKRPGGIKGVYARRVKEGSGEHVA